MNVTAPAKGSRRLSLFLREAIGDVGFDFWVRVWKDGDIWVGPAHYSAARRDALVTRLRSLGYRTECNGKSGTSGEGIVEVFLS